MSGQIPQTLQMQAPAPASPIASANVNGNSGNARYAYYVIANYPSGAVISQAAIVNNAPAVLSGGNYVNVGWQALNGAVTYDVIRLLPTDVFTGSCTCGLMTGLTTTSFNDTGGSSISYTIGAQAPSAQSTLYVNNIDYAPPQLRQVINGVDSAVGGGGGGGSGTVTRVTISGTGGEITVSGTCNITVTGTCTLSVPSNFILPGTINKLTLTQPATGATLTVVDGKTFRVNNTITLAGSSDGLAITFPITGTAAMQNGANTFTGGTQDASGAPHTLPVKVVANTGLLPATCTAGELALVTASTLGQQIYECSAGNVWTQQLNSGGGGGLPAGSPGQTIVYNSMSIGTAVTVTGDSTLNQAGVMTNVGINGVPLCAGFTPTNGQVLTYTTGGSPNPCYTAVATTTGGTVTQINTTGPITGGPINTTGTVACPTCGQTTNPLSQFASTTSAQLAGAISNETGSPGLLVFNNNPVIGLANGTGLPNAGLVNASTTVNNQTCTLGASCLIPLSAVNAQASTYTVLASDFSNYKTIVVSAGSFTITLVAAGGSQPPAGQYINIINYGSGTITLARNGQSINGATTSLTLTPGFSYAPSNSYVISDGTNYFATLSNSNTLANAGQNSQILQSLGPGSSGFFDFPDWKVVPAANCVSGSAGSSLSTSIVQICYPGTNNLGGVLPFVDGNSAQFNYDIPLDWSGAQPYLRLSFSSGSNTSGTVIFNVRLACTKANFTTTSDPPFNSPDAFLTQTMPAANMQGDTTVQTTQLTSGNNCVPGGTVLVSITRATDTASSAVNVDKVMITMPRRPVTQAN